MRFNGSYSASLIKAVSCIITVTSSSLLSWPIVSWHKDSSLPAEVIAALSPAGTREDRASVWLTETPSPQLHDTITSLHHTGIKILRLWGVFFHFATRGTDQSESKNSHAGLMQVVSGSAEVVKVSEHHTDWRAQSQQIYHAYIRSWALHHTVR